MKKQSRIMNRQEIIEKYFYKIELYWVRRKDSYRFNEEEMNLAIDYYTETGQEP